MLNNLNMKTKKFILGLLVAVLLPIFATGCSSKPPKDVIKQAIISQQPFLQIKPELMDDYDITNSYSKDEDNETVYIYEYEVKFTSGGKNTGTLELVKRGSEWYALNN